MKAVLIDSVGSPEVLQLQEINKPTLSSPTDVLVKLKAASINPLDAKLRSGLYPMETFPAILGCDGAGIIEACGADVTRFNVDDEVYFFHGGVDGTQGNYAEYKVLNERFVTHKPKSQDFIEAAASPLVLLTAWEALFDRASLEKNQTVFINAGGGGVGHVAIQLAKQFGAKICTTASNKEKTAFVKNLGADYIINYKEQDIVNEIIEWTDGKGVDVALDNVGGNEIQATFPAIKHYGKMVTLVKPDSNVDWAEARLRNISFNFEVMLSPLLFDIRDKQLHQTWILEQSAKLIDEEKLKIHISDTFPLENANKAHHQIESGRTMGKIVLDIQ